MLELLKIVGMFRDGLNAFCTMRQKSYTSGKGRILEFKIMCLVVS